MEAKYENEYPQVQLVLLTVDELSGLSGVGFLFICTLYSNMVAISAFSISM